MRLETTRAAGTRGGFGCGVAFLTGVAVIVVVCLISAALFVLGPSNNRASASFIQSQSGAIAWNGHQPITILLMGTEAAPGTHPAASTLMIVSFNPSTHRMHLLSIPDTLWVTIPGFGTGKISDAYMDGGARLALLTVQSVTHVVIPYYAVVGSDTLKQIVDAVGGISIRWSTSSQDAAGYLHIHSVAHQLNGASTLAYLKTGGGSGSKAITKMRRSQRTFLAIQTRMLQQDVFFQIPTIVNTLGGSIDTNFPYAAIPTLAHALLSVSNATIKRDVLGYGNYSVTDYAGAGEHVFLPDWGRIRSVARSMFADPGIGVIPVDVQNGAGLSGAASSLAASLRQAGVRVKSYESARAFTYAKTQVVVQGRPTTSTLSVARSIATLLQAPLVQGRIPAATAPIVVLIGQDFQDLNQQ